jgi:hypothetical protein
MTSMHPTSPLGCTHHLQESWVSLPAFFAIGIPSDSGGSTCTKSIMGPSKARGVVAGLQGCRVEGLKGPATQATRRQ